MNEILYEQSSDIIDEIKKHIEENMSKRPNTTNIIERLSFEIKCIEDLYDVEEGNSTDYLEHILINITEGSQRADEVEEICDILEKCDLSFEPDMVIGAGFKVRIFFYAPEKLVEVCDTYGEINRCPDCNGTNISAPDTMLVCNDCGNFDF